MSIFETLQRNPRDPAALAAWYREVYPSLYRLALRLADGNRTNAEDLCHDAFLGFFRNCGAEMFVSAESAFAYLKRSVIHTQISMWRRSRRLVSLETEPEISEQPAGPDVALENYEQLLSHLRAEDQKLLALIIAGEPLSRIAEILGVSYSNAGVRVHRIRKKIKGLVDGSNSDVKTSLSQRY